MTDTEKNAKKPEKEEVITIKKQDLWKYSTFVLSGVVLILLIALFAGGPITGNAVANNPTPSNPGAAPSHGGGAAPTVDIEINENGNLLGNPDAPVEIIEFSDFQCPFCSRASPTVKALAQKYGDDIVIEYRHFPLDSIHPQARPAALASECAAEQGKFWEYHDELFANMQGLGDAFYKSLAGQLGLNQAQFDECYDSQKYADKVQADFTSGTQSGVRGTPGFIVDGQLVSGAQPQQAFEAIIDAALA